MPERDCINKVGHSSLRFEAGRSMLTVREVSSKLRVSPQHVLDLIAEGQIQALGLGRRGRRHWRIPVEEYEKYLKMVGSRSLTI